MSLLVGTLVLAQGFAVRTGTWEFSAVVEGAIPLNDFPPAMRAQVEEELRRPRVFKSCVTAEDLKTLNLGRTEDSEDDDCKVATSRMTLTTGDIVRQCEGDEAYTETTHFEAATAQALRATVTKKTAAGAMTMRVTGKWVAAQCRD